ncbi:hypothetical protein TNCV_3247581 [Trichonephila clavipes]|nr:hypothetical protein TNCV_3247581 [Trichonephila clavipes]
MRTYSFHIQKIYRLLPESNPQSYTFEAGTLPLRNRAEIQTDREVTDPVPTPISGFKVHRMRGDKDQRLNNSPGCVQAEMILHHVFLLKQGRIPPLRRHQNGKRFKTLQYVFSDFQTYY